MRKLSNSSKVPDEKQRVVILPGPHKTATTSVQSFLVKLQKNDKLGNFEWPATSSKAFAPVMKSVLFEAEDSHSFRKRKQEKILKAWKHGKSVVFGAEVLDFVAALSPEEAKPVFERLMNLLPKEVDPAKDVSVAVMYRTPRSSHLVSAWKQQLAMAARAQRSSFPWRTAIEKNKEKSKKEAPNLAWWLCTGHWKGRMDFDVANIVAAQLNPLGVADYFDRYGNTTTIVGDMSNIDDVPNTVACEVLKIPCSDDGKAKDAKVLNQRSNPTELGMKDKDMEEVEDILRRMDCHYYCGSLKDKLTVLHANDEMFTNSKGWNQCCASPDSWLTPSEAHQKLQNLGCRAAGKKLKEPEEVQELDWDKWTKHVSKKASTPKPETEDFAELDWDKWTKHIAKEASKGETTDYFPLSSADSAIIPGVFTSIAFFLALAGFLHIRKRRRPKDHIVRDIVLPVPTHSW